jgi:hypothetical protein
MQRQVGQQCLRSRAIGEMNGSVAGKETEFAQQANLEMSLQF